MLLNGNSLQENGTILDSILTLPFVRETLIMGFFLVQISTENGFFREHWRSLLYWEIRLFRKCSSCLNSLSSCHRTVSGFSQLRSSYKKIFENQEFTWAGAVKTKLISLSTLARELGFHFVWDPSWVMKKIPFSIFVSSVDLVNSITHVGNWTEKKQYSWDWM